MVVGAQPHAARLEGLKMANYYTNFSASAPALTESEKAWIEEHNGGNRRRVRLRRGCDR